MWLAFYHLINDAKHLTKPCHYHNTIKYINSDTLGFCSRQTTAAQKLFKLCCAKHVYSKECETNETFLHAK